MGNPTALLLGQNLIHQMKAKCSVENVSVLAMATVLDPLFKTLTFGNQTDAQGAVKRITAECSKYIQRSSATTQVIRFPLYHIVIV